jgi:hypothetical protein
VEFLQAFGILSRGRIFPRGCRAVPARELNQLSPLNRIPLHASSLDVPEAKLPRGGVNRRRRKGRELVHRSVQAGDVGELRLIRLSSTPTNRKHRWEHENHKKWRHLADIESIRVPASFRPETEGCAAQRTTLLWLPYRTVFTEPFALLQLRNAQVDRVFLVLDEDDALSGFRDPLRDFSPCGRVE